MPEIDIREVFAEDLKKMIIRYGKEIDAHDIVAILDQTRTMVFFSLVDQFVDELLSKKAAEAAQSLVHTIMEQSDPKKRTVH